MNNNISDLNNAIINSDTTTIKKLFTSSDVNYTNICNIICNPKLYSVLKFILENNDSVQICMRKIFSGNDIIRYVYTHINVELLYIILSYLSSDKLLENILKKAIYTGNLEILDILFESGYDIRSAFDKIAILFGNVYSQRIKFNAFMYLVKYGIDIMPHINSVCVIFCHDNDVAGVDFCFANGTIVADDIITKIHYPLNIDMINCLSDNGANWNKLRFDNIIYIMDTDCHNFSVIIYLIKIGLDINNYMCKLMKYSAPNSTEVITYFINSGISVDILNELLPWACAAGNIAYLEILLENGADIHYNDNSILNFICERCVLGRYNSRWFSVANFLIKNGATSNNMTYTFCAYANKLTDILFDEELFTYFLDNGVDPNSKFDSDIKKKYIHNNEIEYILDALIDFDEIKLFKLCLKYGADPYIGNHSPLKISIRQNRLDFIKLLLDMGSIVDSESEYYIEQTTIDLLDSYQINHNYVTDEYLRKKIEK